MTNAIPDPKPQTEIKPVDDFVRAGFCHYMIEQFRAPTIFVTSPDALTNLKAMLGNKQPEYPYIFLWHQTSSPNTDGYTTNRMARHGIPVTLSNDNKQFQMAKVLPTNFEIEATYVTNKMDGMGPEAVNQYMRRWLFTRRNGAINFQIDYGLSRLTIGVTLSDSISIPKRENPADTESVYQVVSNITIHGYVSEPALGTRGRINQIVLQDGPALKPGQQFFPF